MPSSGTAGNETSGSSYGSGWDNWVLLIDAGARSDLEAAAAHLQELLPRASKVLLLKRDRQVGEPILRLFAEVSEAELDEEGEIACTRRLLRWLRRRRYYLAAVTFTGDRFKLSHLVLWLVRARHRVLLMPSFGGRVRRLSGARFHLQFCTKILAYLLDVLLTLWLLIPGTAWLLWLKAKAAVAGRYRR